MPTQEPIYAKRFINIDNALQTGFELNFNYQFFPHWNFNTDLSYTYGQNKDFDEPLPQVVPLTAHLALNYNNERFWFNLRSRLVAEQNRIAPSFGEQIAPGFAIFDLSAGYKPLKYLTIGAAILNIFDTAYYEHLNFSYKNSDLLNGRIYEPGRNFTIYINYSF
jgi:iron complex outermembrane receptor protein